MPSRSLLLCVLALPLTLSAQGARPPAAQRDTAVTILRPARVFDGEVMREGWAVRVRGDRIETVGIA